MFRFLLFIFIIMSFSPPGAARADIDHLAIRHHQSGKLLYKNDTRSYYMTRSDRGYPYLVVIHDVPVEQRLVDIEIFGPRTDDPNGLSYVLKPSEDALFNQYVLPAFMRETPNSQQVWAYHYNARVLFQAPADKLEEAIVITKYRAPNYKEPKGKWHVYYGIDHLNPQPDAVYDPKYTFFSAKEAMRLRKVATQDLAAANQQAQEVIAQKKAAETAEKQAKVAAVQSARKPGIVYKSVRFWDGMNNFQPVIDTFDGKFTGLGSNVEFKNFFVDFVAGYSNYCHDYLPATTDRQTFTSQEVTYDGNGFEKWRGPVTTTTIDIDPRFTPSYLKFQDDVKTYNGMKALKMTADMYKNIAQGMQQRGNTLGGVMGNAINEAISTVTYFDMLKFFKKTKCNTATMYQMRENMLRAATGKLSLQAASVRIKNAEAESDAAETVATQKTFLQSCRDYHAKSEYSMEKWCTCLDKEARKVMRPDELSRFAGNFSSYYIDVDSAPKSGPNDPLWRLMEPIIRCRK